MLKRQKQVTVRFTEKEYIQLKSKCDAAGMKMEPFLRALVSGCTLRERRRTVIKPWRRRWRQSETI